MTATSDPFRIRSHVREFDLLTAGYQQSSEQARARWRSAINISYGGHPDERLDLFFPNKDGGPKPIHLFIHGGYWRANIKDDYAFIAETVCRAGAIAAVADYSLMPAARMATLVAQVRRAAFWLHANAEDFGGDKNALSASGHSAGAHLAAYLAAHGLKEERCALAPIRSLLLVSGIYELEPITQSFLQTEIGLTRDEIAEWSPINAALVGKTDVTIAVGGDETAPFHSQAMAFSRHLRKQAVRERLVTLPALNHMTIMRDLGCPETATAKLLKDCINQPAAHSAIG